MQGMSWLAENQLTSEEVIIADDRCSDDRAVIDLSLLVSHQGSDFQNYRSITRLLWTCDVRPRVHVFRPYTQCPMLCQNEQSLSQTYAFPDLRVISQPQV
jgi:hypothetical protein